ncbi:MAG: hypothetical protein ACJATN_001351 [Neolewinella sp.]
MGAHAGAWQGLGFVAAGANYHFDDRTALPHTDYLYRMRQQDVDGRVDYSEVRTARFGEAAGAISLYPNPTSGDVQYRIASSETDLPYELIDVNGRVLAKGLLASGGGTLRLADKAAGVYFVRVAGDIFGWCGCSVPNWTFSPDRTRQPGSFLSLVLPHRLAIPISPNYYG